MIKVMEIAAMVIIGIWVVAIIMMIFAKIEEKLGPDEPSDYLEDRFMDKPP